VANDDWDVCDDIGIARDDDDADGDEDENMVVVGCGCGVVSRFDEDEDEDDEDARVDGDETGRRSRRFDERIVVVFDASTRSGRRDSDRRRRWGGVCARDACGCAMSRAWVRREE